MVHHEPGLLVTRFVEGRTLTADDVRQPAPIARLAAMLRHLHQSWDTMTGEVLYFCPFQTVRTYARTAARLGADLPAEIDDLLEDTRRLSHRIAPFRPVPCHNDLLPANLIDDGRSLWLVDWEYAGIGHPLFDLANLAANAALDDDQELGLLTAYRGSTESPRPRRAADLPGRVDAPRGPLGDDPVGRLRHRIRLSPLRRRALPGLSRSASPARDEPVSPPPRPPVAFSC